MSEGAEAKGERREEKVVLRPQAPGSKRLRRVEEDVLIPKLKREKIKDLCAKEIKEFAKCCRGRTVSMVWACRQQNKEMQDCLITEFNKEELDEQCRKEYFKKRDEHWKKLQAQNKI